jgi:hypothetical protein
VTYKLAKTSRDADQYFGAVSLLLDGTDLQDKSLDTKTITVNGDAQVSTAQSKWNGSSLAFDGNGDYLLTGYNGGAFDFGSDNWTVEFWIYLPSLPSSYRRIYSYMSGSTESCFFEITNSNRMSFGIYSGGTLLLATDPSAMTSGVWTHFAGVRNGSNLSLFSGGVEVATLNVGTSSANTGASFELFIGRWKSNIATRDLNGYLQDLRVTKGVARYTANFTPPTQPFTPAAVAPDYDPYFFPNVSLLLKGDGTNGSTNIVDSSYPAKTITVNGDAQISTAESKFGGSSLYFDGTGDYLTTATHVSDFNFGTGDFTIEFWINSTQTSRTDPFAWNFDYTLAGWGSFILNTSSGRIDWYEGLGIATYATSTGWNDGSWHHLAVSRSGTSLKMFLDGVQIGSTATSSYSYGASNVGVSLGFSASTGYYLNGYIDDIRLTKGVARYTSNFTPPTKAFPNY